MVAQAWILLAVIWWADAISTSGGRAPNLVHTVLLTDAVASHGAMCLDGSPQRYWLQKSTSTVNATKWVIDFMGGAWCEDVAECADRAYGSDCYFGSSNASCFATAGSRVPGAVFNDTMDLYDIPACDGARWCGGLMSNNAATNPTTHDWNKVLVHYCDGTSYSGVARGSAAATLCADSEV